MWETINVLNYDNYKVCPMGHTAFITKTFYRISKVFEILTLIMKAIELVQLLKSSFCVTNLTKLLNTFKIQE